MTDKVIPVSGDKSALSSVFLFDTSSGGVCNTLAAQARLTSAFRMAAADADFILGRKLAGSHLASSNRTSSFLNWQDMHLSFSQTHAVVVQFMSIYSSE